MWKSRVARVPTIKNAHRVVCLSFWDWVSTTFMEASALIGTYPIASSLSTLESTTENKETKLVLRSSETKVARSRQSSVVNPSLPNSVTSISSSSSSSLTPSESVNHFVKNSNIRFTLPEFAASISSSSTSRLVPRSPEETATINKRLQEVYATACNYSSAVRPGFVCRTCSSEGVLFMLCQACSISCHFGHEVTRVYNNNFFCGCGTQGSPCRFYNAVSAMAVYDKLYDYTRENTKLTSPPVNSLADQIITLWSSLADYPYNRALLSTLKTKLDQKIKAQEAQEGLNSTPTSDSSSSSTSSTSSSVITAPPTPLPPTAFTEVYQLANPIDKSLSMLDVLYRIKMLADRVAIIDADGQICVPYFKYLDLFLLPGVPQPCFLPRYSSSQYAALEQSSQTLQSSVKILANKFSNARSQMEVAFLKSLGSAWRTQSVPLAFKLKFDELMSGTFGVNDDQARARILSYTWAWNAISLRRTELYLANIHSTSSGNSYIPFEGALRIVHDICAIMSWQADRAARIEWADILSHETFTLKDCKRMVPIMQKLSDIFATVNYKQVLCILSMSMNLPFPLEYLPSYASLCGVEQHVLHYLNLFDATEADIPFHDKLIVSKCGLANRLGQVAGSTLGQVLEYAMIVHKGSVDESSNSGYGWRCLLRLDWLMRREGSHVTVSGLTPLPPQLFLIRKQINIDLTLLRFLYGVLVDPEELTQMLTNRVSALVSTATSTATTAVTNATNSLIARGKQELSVDLFVAAIQKLFNVDIKPFLDIITKAMRCETKEHLMEMCTTLFNSVEPQLPEYLDRIASNVIPDFKVPMSLLRGLFKAGALMFEGSCRYLCF
jgi:hypothetical protein